jgi:hypothetical protein
MISAIPDGGVRAYDSGRSRLTDLGPNGELIETVSWRWDGCGDGFDGVAGMAFECRPVRVLADGWTVVQQGHRFPFYGLPRLERFWVVHDGAFRQVDSVYTPAPVPAGSVQRGGRESRIADLPLFTAYERVAIGPTGLVLGRGDRYELRFRDGTGDVRRILRVDRPARPVTQDAITRHLEGHDVFDGYLRLHSEAILRTLGTADSIPHFSKLALDDLGRVWVQDQVFSYDGPIEWTVFEETGAPLARAEIAQRWDSGLPGALRLHQIGRDFVLGVEFDDLGVERVVMYSIEGSS